jgi:hypothetical protein
MPKGPSHAITVKFTSSDYMKVLQAAMESGKFRQVQTFIVAAAVKEATAFLGKEAVDPSQAIEATKGLSSVKKGPKQAKVDKGAVHIDVVVPPFDPSKFPSDAGEAAQPAVGSAP